MQNQTELRNNYVWPKHDVACWKYLNKRLDTPKIISNHCNNHRIIIQAGGNAGLYVDHYAKLFDFVYSFEPDPLNFFCLTNNTAENVFKFQSCLGKDNSFVNLTENNSSIKKPNTGGYQVNGSGYIPTLTIDSFNFPFVDCIHLDIEGYELFALEGALQTIKKHKPVIALEMNHLSKNYGYGAETLFSFLENLNYKQIGNADDDNIFAYNT